MQLYLVFVRENAAISLIYIGYLSDCDSGRRGFEPRQPPHIN